MPKIEPAPFVPGVTGPDASMETRIRRAVEPACAAEDKARMSLGIVTAGLAQMNHAHEILRSGGLADEADALVPIMQEHEKAVVRAEIAWARAYVMAHEHYRPNVAMLDAADEAVEIARDEIAKRAKAAADFAAKAKK